jgi:hypothetical protein
MKCRGWLIVAVLSVTVCSVWRLAQAADAVMTREDLSKKVLIRDATIGDDGAVSGTLVNTSGHRLQEVRLLVRHDWLWRDEFHPGADSPGTAGYYVVPQEIPPGGSVSFSYRPDPPLPRRSDGTFQTTVEVAGLLEYPG